MPLFYHTKANDGTDVLINAEMVVAYKRDGKTTIAICFGNVALTINEPLEKVARDIEDLFQEDNDD